MKTDDIFISLTDLIFNAVTAHESTNEYLWLKMLLIVKNHLFSFLAELNWTSLLDA